MNNVASLPKKKEPPSKTKTKVLNPLPIFDSLENLEEQFSGNYLATTYYLPDIQQAYTFLKAYRGSKGTFNSYRREIERLLHWCALIANKSLKELRRQDIEAFVEFCQTPPRQWIGVYKHPRFLVKEGLRLPNPDWRPFVATVTKAANRKGMEPDPKNFMLSHGAIKELFAILSSFFNYLLQEEHVYMNPIALIRQKSKFIRKHQSQAQIRRLSEVQWQYALNTAKKLAIKNPAEHERTLFILCALYSMYLRISELAADLRWTPKMNNFVRDSEGNWWFVTVGKGNKHRQIAVSDEMLNALKRWRNHLGLSPVPSPADNSPLVPRNKGKGPISHTNSIRKIVQYCFDQTAEQLTKDGFIEDAENLIAATVHWLRHTGISDDVKRRPREHVRDDAGHSTSAVTDKYIDIELRERHRSAKKKPLIERQKNLTNHNS